MRIAPPNSAVKAVILAIIGQFDKPAQINIRPIKFPPPLIGLAEKFPVKLICLQECGQLGIR
jgi:hypothetical protein